MSQKNLQKPSFQRIAAHAATQGVEVSKLTTPTAGMRYSVRKSGDPRGVVVCSTLKEAAQGVGIMANLSDIIDNLPR